MDDERWIIDTDPGCDDMVAIMYLLKRLRDKVELVSVTQGNCSMKDTTRNIRKILKIMEYQPLVMCGGEPIFQGSPHCYSFHKIDGLGNVKDFQTIDYESIKITPGSAVLKIVELCLKYPKKINIFTIGPLTNVALAYMLCPEIVNLVKDFYIMGGSTKSRGNHRPLAEMNFGFDPIATKIVMDSFKNLVVCTWECCEGVKILSSDLFQMKEEAIKVSPVKVHTSLYEALFKILQVFDFDEGGLDICDLYCLICFFNKNVVRNFTVCMVDCVIDSAIPYGNGMMVLNRIKYHGSNFDKALSYFKQNNAKNYKILVETLDPIVARTELCSIFLDYN